MKFDRGFISPYFISDAKTQTVELENPYILLVETKVSSLQQLVPLLERIIKIQSVLLIVAKDVKSKALTILVVNKLCAGIKVCAVMAPGFGDNRKATILDLTILTGRNVVSGDAGVKLETVIEDEWCELIRLSIESTKRIMNVRNYKNASLN